VRGNGGDTGETVTEEKVRPASILRRESGDKKLLS